MPIQMLMGRRDAIFRSVWRPTAVPTPEVVAVRARAARRGVWVQLAALVRGVVYVAITDEPVKTGWFGAGLTVSSLC